MPTTPPRDALPGRIPGRAVDSFFHDCRSLLRPDGSFVNDLDTQPEGEWVTLPSRRAVAEVTAWRKNWHLAAVRDLLFTDRAKRQQNSSTLNAVMSAALCAGAYLRRRKLLVHAWTGHCDEYSEKYRLLSVLTMQSMAAPEKVSLTLVDSCLLRVWSVGLTWVCGGMQISYIVSSPDEPPVPRTTIVEETGAAAEAGATGGDTPPGLQVVTKHTARPPKHERRSA